MADGKPDDEHLAALVHSGPVVGSVWRHANGGYYRVVCVSLDEASLDVLVTYESVPARGVVRWTRTLAVWNRRFRTYPGCVEEACRGHPLNTVVSIKPRPIDASR